jgi:hypothetical protein
LSLSLLVLQAMLASLAMLTTWASHYLAPLGRALFVVAVVWMAQRGWFARARFRRFVAAAFVVGFVATPWSHPVPTDARPWPDVQRVALPPATQQKLAGLLAQTPATATVWSTYTGLYDAARDPENGGNAVNRARQPDYLIHALGPQARDAYADAFIAAKPDYVRTPRADVIWQRWLVATNARFFTALVEDYEPLPPVETEQLWRRRDLGRALAPPGAKAAADSGRATDGSDAASDQGNTVAVTIARPCDRPPFGDRDANAPDPASARLPPPVLLATTVEYSSTNMGPGASPADVPSRNVIRWRSSRDRGAVAVPKWTNQWTILMLAAPGEPVSVCASTELLSPWDETTIVTATARTVPVSETARRGLILMPFETPAPEAR